MKILITGKPGTGKTTLIRKIIASIDLPQAGFFTEEIRERQTRKGFRFVTLDGKEGILAYKGLESQHRVGCYGVSLDQFDRLVVPSLAEGLKQGCLLVIDEIGKMELLSSYFRQILTEIFNSHSFVLATIGQFTHPLVFKIKNQLDVFLLELRLDNRLMVEEKIKKLLEGVMK